MDSTAKVRRVGIPVSRVGKPVSRVIIPVSERYQLRIYTWAKVSLSDSVRDRGTRCPLESTDMNIADFFDKKDIQHCTLIWRI